MSSYSAQDVVDALVRAGLALVSQRGSHRKYRAERSGRTFTAIVKFPASEIPAGTLSSILRQAGLSREEFESLLGRRPPTGGLAERRRRLRHLYRAFNAREIESVLAALALDVDWPNGMDGGREVGQEAVRAYWLRQWGQIDPHVEPGAVSQRPGGEVEVAVHQVVRDLSGTVLSERDIRHVYWFRDGLVARMEIEG